MIEYRRIVPETDTLDDLKPGNYISFPKDEKFPNLSMLYVFIPKTAFELIKPIIPKRPEEWTWNKMLFILAEKCEDSDMALAVYKHDDRHYVVTIHYSEEYIDSL